MDVLVENFVRGESESAESEIASGLVSGQFHLHKLVEVLGPALTSQDVESREKGTKLLANVLHSAPSFQLQPMEVTLLVEFFCNRLSDRHIVIPHVLSGFLAIVMYHRLVSGQAEKICRAIFRDVQIQAFPQKDRRGFYNMAAIWLEKYLEEVKVMGNDFVFGYIQTMDGEKDPRNLVICFRTVKFIINHLPFDLFVEDLFEVVACYFPVDFTAPPNDPHGITKDDLVLGLRNCFSATRKFAPFCIPLLMEKLESSVKNAKLDSLQTLTACCNVYTASDLEPFLEELWRGIRQEIFHALHEEVQEEALNTLQVIVRTLSATVTKALSPSALEKYLELILRECKEDIKDPEQRRINATGKVIQFLSAAADPACVFVMDATLLTLLDQYTQTAITSHQLAILEVIQQLLSSAQRHSNPEVPSPVLTYKDHLLMTLYTTLNHSNSAIICAGISTLVSVIQLPHLLQEEELKVTANNFVLLITGECEEKAGSAARQALAVLSVANPETTENAVIPSLLHFLKLDGNETGSSSSVVVNKVVTTLAAVCTCHKILQIVVPKLLDFLTSLIKGKAQLDERISLGMTVLHCFALMVQEHQANLDDVTYFRSFLLPYLIAASVDAGMEKGSDLFSAVEMLNSVCTCIKLIVSSVEISVQKVLASSISSLFLDGSCTEMPIKIEGKFQPLEPTSPWKQTQLVSILTSIVCHTNKEIMTDRQSILIAKLFNLASCCPHEITCREAAKCGGGLVNRMPDSGELNSYVTDATNQLSGVMEEGSAQAKKQALAIFIWLCKALVTRSHPMNQALTDKLIRLLESGLSIQAADGFQVILSSSEDVMSDYKKANVKLMYKQHFFLETVPKLIKKFNDSEDDKKEPYLRALSHILLAVPKEVLLAELPSLLPLLILSLSSLNAPTKKASLSVLLPLIHEAPLFFSQQVEVLLPCLGRLTKLPNEMKVRILAIQCIGAFTSFPHHTVYPMKNQITRDLATALDDRKRLVRKEAVKCRSLWFMLGDSPS